MSDRIEPPFNSLCAVCGGPLGRRVDVSYWCPHCEMWRSRIEPPFNSQGAP